MKSWRKENNVVKIEDLRNLDVHSVLVKNSDKRIYLGIRGSFVFYKKKMDGRKIGEYKDDFQKWLRKAEILEV